MAIFNGSIAPDFISGGAEDDIIKGFGGLDVLFGNGGNAPSMPTRAKIIWMGESVMTRCMAVPEVTS